MSVVYFSEENAFTDRYRKHGLKDVLTSIDRELEDVLCLIFTVNESLRSQSVTPNETRVTEMAGNITHELQYKIKKLTRHLSETGGPVILEVPNPHIRQRNSNGGGA
jgi:hypothetical protein